MVGNVRYKGLHEVQLDMYDPPSQTTVGTTTSLVVRFKPGQERNALAVATAIQTQARQSDPRALVSGISMLDDIVNKEIAPWRFSAWVFALFAGLAFALAMLGLFSLVTSRRGESPAGVRDSHGRRRHRPSHRQRRVPIGGDARGARHRRRSGRWRRWRRAACRALLFGVPLVDALTYGSVIALVAVVVAVASYLPARRAASADPLALLRRE